MQIILTSVEPSLASAWKKFCGDLDFVAVYEGSIFDVPCDAVVSPANSFGFMDGGIDMLDSKRFGWGVQERLQELIREHHHGELLVGAAEIVETNAAIPYLIAAPTMRVPMRLRDSVNPYLAARAALLLIQRGCFRTGKLKGTAVADVVERVAFPGLGTGVGQVGPTICAHQMRAAIEDVLVHFRPFPTSWAEAQARHQQLYTSSIRDLQRE